MTREYKPLNWIQKACMVFFLLSLFFVFLSFCYFVWMFDTRTAMPGYPSGRILFISGISLFFSAFLCSAFGLGSAPDSCEDENES